MKQYHVTVYATVDDAGRIVGWELCDPTAAPTASDEQVFDTEREQWECGDAGTSIHVDLALAAMLDTAMLD